MDSHIPPFCGIGALWAIVKTVRRSEKSLFVFFLSFVFVNVFVMMWYIRVSTCIGTFSTVVEAIWFLEKPLFSLRYTSIIVDRLVVPRHTAIWCWKCAVLMGAMEEAIWWSEEHLFALFLPVVKAGTRCQHGIDIGHRYGIESFLLLVIRERRNSIDIRHRIGHRVCGIHLLIAPGALSWSYKSEKYYSCITSTTYATYCLNKCTRSPLANRYVTISSGLTSGFVMQ